MTALFLIFLVLAAACFLADALKRNPTKYNLFTLGLFFWVLVPLIQTARQLN